MEKITISKRHLDCIKKQLIGNDIIQNCKEYIDAMDNENYEIYQKLNSGLNIYPNETLKEL